MRFLNFVKEHDGIWSTTNRFGKLTALLVADVTRRRTNQTRGGEFFHVLRHVDLNQRVAIAKHEFGELLGEKCFADTGWSEKNKRTNWAPRIFQIGPAAAQRFRDRDDGFILADHFAF